MTKLHLKYVQSFGGYHYFRRSGSPRIPLPGVVGSAEFMEAYQQALAAAPVAIGASKRSKPGSVSAAIAEYYGSQHFRGLTGGTPAKRRTILERFREKHGNMPLASLPKEFVVALLDTMKPTVASNWLTALRHFFQWCEQRKLLRADPTWGIRFKLPKSGGHHTWTEDEIAAFEAHYPVGSKARLALALGLYTAQRRSDVVRIGRQHNPRRRAHGAAAKDQAHHSSHARYSGASRTAEDRCRHARRSSDAADHQNRQELRCHRLQ
jgi:hypothetical protein